MVNRNDVAKKAGVSSAVVSYVINNSNYVSPQKRKAVQKAIKELGYRPNLVARSMKTNRTYSFAIIADDIRNEMFSEFLYYMEMLSFDHGYGVSLCSSRMDDSFLNQLVGRRFDAIFLTSNAFSVQKLNDIAESGLPIIFFQSRQYENLSPHITVLNINFYKTVVLAMEYLIGLGHRRIAFFPPYKYKYNGLYDNGFRSIAYLDMLKKHNLSLDERLVCTQLSSYDDSCHWALEALRASPINQPITAFVVSNDTMAAKLLKTLQDQGINIPQDVSIVGLDDTFSSTITSPTITSVTVDKKQFASVLVDQLIRKANRKNTNDKCFDVNLIIRDSCIDISR